VWNASWPLFPHSASQRAASSGSLSRSSIARLYLASTLPALAELSSSLRVFVHVWMKDLMARKPKPTNTSPGLIYMLNGATQHSFTDPFDRTSPAIPIGPHWMILWPFDAKAAGIGTVMRDGGAMVMFAGTPYAHLHICGSPWDGNEYHPGDRGVWTMTIPGLSPIHRRQRHRGRSGPLHKVSRASWPRAITARPDSDRGAARRA
jgi:hypothetical protein